MINLQTHKFVQKYSLKTDIVEKATFKNTKNLTLIISHEGIKGR